MPYPNTVQLQVKINGTDRTQKVWLSLKSLQIESVLTRQIDTCSFIIGDYANAGFTVKEWDEVVITDLATGTKLFGGFVQQADAALNETGNRLDMTVSAGDYACYLDHVLIKWQYLEEHTDAYILNDLFTLFAPEFDAATFVSNLNTFARIRFNRLTMREVLDQLSGAAGGDWYVDYDKKLHYFLLESNISPFNLSDAPNLSTTFPYENMAKNLDGTGVVNRVEVVGGNYLSSDVTIYLKGTGQDARVILPFAMSAATGETSLKVWRNDGTVGSPVWTAMTVKVGYIDSLAGSTDVLTYFIEKVLEQQNSWPALENAVKVFGRYNIPLRTRYTNFQSYLFYGNRYFDAYINDTSIIDQDTARKRATGLMAKSSLGSTALKCMVRQPGLRSGQTIAVTNSSLGLSASAFFIQRAATTIQMGGYLTCAIDLGIYRPELLDLLVMMARNAKSVPEWRDDEVLQEVLANDEGVLATEANFQPSHTQGPYKWGAATNALVWSFGTWS